MSLKTFATNTCATRPPAGRFKRRDRNRPNCRNISSSSSSSSSSISSSIKKKGVGLCMHFPIGTPRAIGWENFMAKRYEQGEEEEEGKKAQQCNGR